MTNEKMLQLVNKAIRNLENEEKENYGMTPVDFMRKNGIKSTDNMTFFLDSVGVYLEEIRCGLLADIESAEAKKNGKSSVLAVVRKLCKENYKQNVNTKPVLAYAHYDEPENVYYILNPFYLLISENNSGMELMPENVAKNNQSPEYKRYIPNKLDMHEVQLPPIGKISAFLKNKKANKSKYDTTWNRVTFKDFACNGEYLEMFMKITKSTEVFVKNEKSILYMEGNGYKIAFMPTQPYYTDNSTGEKIRAEITDFDNI